MVDHTYPLLETPSHGTVQTTRPNPPNKLDLVKCHQFDSLDIENIVVVDQAEKVKRTIGFKSNRVQVWPPPPTEFY